MRKMGHFGDLEGPKSLVALTGKSVSDPIFQEFSIFVLGVLETTYLGETGTNLQV
jgi:hypothetical protein